MFKANAHFPTTYVTHATSNFSFPLHLKIHNLCCLHRLIHNVYNTLQKQNLLVMALYFTLLIAQ